MVNQGEPGGPDEEGMPTPPRDEKTYRSFYRHYDASTERAGIIEVPQDQLTSTSFEVACYGFNDEFDPLEEITRQRQCVLDFPYSRSDNNPYALSAKGLKTSQKGRGSIAPIPETEDTLPEYRNPDFDAREDLWYPNLGGAFSLLSEPLFTLDYKRSILATFLNLDSASLTASWQQETEDFIANLARNRAGEDTVSNMRHSGHTIDKWWNNFVSSMTRLVSPQSVRLRLPVNMTSILKSLPLQGIDPVTVLGANGEAMGTVSVRGAVSGAASAGKTIEVQLQASEDLLGVLAKALSASFTVVGHPVPVVFPVGSPESYRALAQRWEDYKQQRRSLGATFVSVGPDAYPPEVDELIADLLEYARRSEEYRALRSELPRTLSTLLLQQEQVLLGIEEWTSDNLDRYREFLADRASRLSFSEDIREVQALYAQYADEEEMPWCGMTQFTPPIYALLDPWLPGRPLLDGGIPSCENGDGGGLPLLCVQRQDDLVIDLSNFSRRIDTSAINIPVPEPVGVQFELPFPPDADDDELPSADDLFLPELPPIPLFDEEVLAQFPDVEVQSRPKDLQEVDPLDTSRMRETLERAKTVLRGMATTTSDFWWSSDPSKLTVQLACPDPDVFPCMYDEPELKQILARLTRRPLVLVKEDRELLQMPVTAGCDPQDSSCLPMPPERRPAASGWQVVGAADLNEAVVGVIRQLRINSRDATIDDEGKIQIDETTGEPYPYSSGATDLYPIYDVPPDLRLEFPSDDASDTEP